ncbi:unnamed protein product [Phytomonas sp. Hart1]|nr:unnamed protein product [Phytomonas sp. Hart1]|eukprot:CCW66674.1 unnamed protein product [Phytomonas sp. isolate Hart1]
MLYFAGVEVVLRAAERAWEDNEHPSKKEDEAALLDAQAALLGYIALWSGFFRNLPQDLRTVHLRVKSSSLSPGHFTGLSSESLLITDDNHAERGIHDDESLSSVIYGECPEFEETVQGICEEMHTRLQQGKPPLPALCELIYRNTTNSESNKGMNHPPGHVDNPLFMRSLCDEFDSVQKSFAASAAKLDDNTKLKFYALYKQATVGNVNIAKPWLMDIMGRAKWDAWSKLKGMDLTEAKQMYVSEYKLMKKTDNTK